MTHDDAYTDALDEAYNKGFDVGYDRGARDQQQMDESRMADLVTENARMSKFIEAVGAALREV